MSQTHASSASASHRRASYASSTSSSPAGGRPASGLSRRRAQFRGPPPSFYRSGGWGSHAEKRRTAQGQTGPGTQTGEHRGGYPPHQESQYPFGEQNDVRHFDREAHYRTQQLQDQRRRWRTKMERQRVPMVDGKGIARDLCLIGGMLALIVMIPSMFWSKTKSGNDAAPRRRSQNGD